MLLLAELLGKRYAEISQFVADEKLPVVPVGADKKPVLKILKTQLLNWLNSRQQGKSRMTLEELEQELHDCQSRLEQRGAEKLRRKVQRAGRGKGTVAA